MQKFILAYQGGQQPETQEEGAAQMAKWHKWTENLGSAVIDPGMPIGKAQGVTAEGVNAAGALSSVSGISIIQAESIDDALKMVADCPYLDIGGTVDVAPVMQM
ncbi:YciI family protein [Kordiimonas aquimaris]|uniref:YciI family protein n=1 Tax=Kordiimonas aquimaris TaxID=707591 RepID=UPI0021CFA8E4|nr:YciI family protein [Kordiimonas aquimaris]